MKEVKTNSLHAWILAARPKTLSAAAVPVMIGSALAANTLHEGFQWAPCLFCFLFAFIMQIDANFINDYFDYKKGSDRKDRLGPRRACAEGWIHVPAMKRGILFTTMLACGAGLPLLYYSTYYIQTGYWNWETTVTAVASGLVIDTLLMVNNFRDRDQDRISGKQTVVVRFGIKAGSIGYLLLGFIPCIGCLTLVIGGHIWAAILPQLYLIPHIRTWNRMVEIHQGKALNEILGKTARNIFLFGVLLSAGLLLPLLMQ